MSDLNLTSFNPLYPMRIHQYNELINDQNTNVMDKVNSIIDYLNQVGKLTNDVVKDWNTVYNWVMNEGLTTDVNNKLEAMLANHEFDPIMNTILTKIGDLTTLSTTAKDTIVNAINSLQSDMNTKIGDLTTLQTVDKSSLVHAVNENTTQLAQSVSFNNINPDTYTGTDLQKLQSAFNDAFTKNKGVQLGRVYDITGGSITITKTTSQRLPIYVTASNNGGIKKTDAGFIFNSTTANQSDFFFQGVYFQGAIGQSVKVFNCDYLIRIHLESCYFEYITSIFYCSDTGYLQSNSMVGCTLISIQGAAMDFSGAYDLVCDRNLMEQSVGYFINHRGTGSNANIYGGRILNNNIEGITGTNPAMVLNTCEAVKIDGNYFEMNAGGHIYFNPSAGLYSVTISNNHHGGSPETGVTALVVWPRSLYGAVSIGNSTDYLGIHDATQVVSTAFRINSVNDTCVFSGTNTDPNKVIDITSSNHNQYVTTYSNPLNGASTQFGGIKRLSSGITITSIPANSTADYVVSFPENIYFDDAITAQLYMGGVANVFINYMYRDTATKTNVHVVITNNTATPYSNIALRLNVIKLTGYTMG